MSAIQHAQRVCDWYENLSKEEHPPSWMWPYEEELEIWFADVETKRNEKYGGTSASDSSDSDMIHNELAQGVSR